MWPDPILILAFEIVGVSFLLGCFVAVIVREEMDKHYECEAAETAFFNANLNTKDSVNASRDR